MPHSQVPIARAESMVGSGERAATACRKHPLIPASVGLGFGVRNRGLLAAAQAGRHHLAQPRSRVLQQPEADGLAGNGVVGVATDVQVTGLRAGDVQGTGRRTLGPRGRVQHGQVQIFQPRRSFVFQPDFIKIFAHQVELGVHAQVQNSFGVFGIARRSGATRGAVAELDNSMATLVAGARIHAVALHQGHTGKVVGRKVMLFGQAQNFVVHRRPLLRWDKTFGHRAVQCFLQNRVLNRVGSA